MLVRIAEIDIDPARVAAYRAALAVEIADSLAREPGVLFLFAVAVAGSPATVRVIEGYADQAAYEAHLTTPHFLAYKAGTAAMVRALRLIETDPIRLESRGAILIEEKQP
jgi:quinol monooxygenase YgiN